MLLREMLLSFSKTSLSSIGTVWLFIEMYNGLMPQRIDCSFWCLIIIAFVLAIILFLLNGFMIEGFLRQTIVLKSNAFNTKIIIKFGDLFGQDGWKVIPVNEFFDCVVDDMHVSSNSLHGILIQEYWKNNAEDWYQQVTNSLSDKEFIGNVPRSKGKSAKYRIGATAVAKKNDNNFLCVALTKTDIDNLWASASPPELYHSLTCLLAKSREVCGGSPLNIPLIGSGLSKTGIKTNVLVDVILIAIFEESRKSKITDEIRIILHKNKKEDIDLNTIRKDWS